MLATGRRLDLRGFPVAERLEVVARAVEALGRDEVFSFLTEIDPRALIATLHARFARTIVVHYLRVGANEWQVEVCRVEGAGDGTPAHVLRRIPAFSTVPDAARAALAEAAEERVARKGRAICEAEEAYPFLGVVVEGALALVSGSNARPCLLQHYFAYDTFAEAEFFDSGKTIGRYVAMSRSARVLCIPDGAVRAVGAEYPALLVELGSTCAQRVRAFAHAVCAQAARPIVARVAEALMPYAVPSSQLEPALAPLPQMTQTQIAAAAGTVKEVAARAIGQLEKAGAVRRERGHVRYLNRELLIEAATAP